MHELQPSNIAWLGCDLTCGYWEVVDEVEPITCFIIKPLGVTFTLCLLPCYARRRGLVSESMTDVRLLINGST